MEEPQRVEIPFPFRGLNDSEGLTDQPEGTTTHARNVRPFDPKTGRRRGSQRAGLEKWSTTAISGSNRPQAIVPVSYAKNRLSYEEASSANGPTLEWSKVTPSADSAKAIKIDKNGYIYVIDGGTNVLKYNPDGTLLTTLSIPIAFTPATSQIAVDEFGSIYAGLGESATNRGFVQRWKLEEDEEYSYSWAIDVPGLLRDLYVVNDLLYVAVDTGPYLDVASGSTIIVYSGLTSDYTPARVWDKSVPHPLHGIAVKGDGTLFWTAAANEERMSSDVGDTGGEAGYAESTVNWTPLHIDNAASRLHYWLDCSYFALQSVSPAIQHLDHLNNHSIPSITSRTDEPYVGASVTAADQSDRATISPGQTWIRFHNSPVVTQSGIYERSGPQFVANSWGEMPSLAFTQKDMLTMNTAMPVQETGCALVTGHNAYGDKAFDDVKLNLTDALEKNEAPFPGAENAKYIYAMCGRVDFANSSARSIVFTIGDRGGSSGGSAMISMMVNADQSGDGTTHAEDTGKITIFMKGAKFTNDAEDPTLEEDWRPYDLQGLDADGRFILTIVMDPSGTRKGAIRLNGRALDSFTVTDASAWRLEGKGRDDAANSYPDENLPAGRVVFGGPTPGHNWAAGDRLTAGDTADQDGYPYAERMAWNEAGDGQPAWTSPVSHASFGGNVAGTTVASGAYVVGAKCGHFSGEITEALTMLADSTGTTGGNINDDSAGLVPYKTGSVTAERDRTKCNSPSGSTDVEKIEGYLAWKWGIASLLPADDSGGTVDGLVSLHPFKTAPPASAADETVLGNDNDAYTEALLSELAITGKVTPNGDGQWAVNGGGMGYAVATNENDVYTVGPKHPDAVNSDTGNDEASVTARKLIDKGAVVSAKTDDGAWVASTTEDWASDAEVKYPRIAVDTDGNLYYPWIKGNGDTPYIVKRQNSDGGAKWTQSVADSNATNFAVALPQTQPNYNDDTVTGPEFIYIVGDNGAFDGTIDLASSTLHKYRQVHVEQDIADGVSTRDTVLVAAANGKYRVYATDGTTSGDMFNDEDRYISGTAAFQKAYFTNGIDYNQYDPKKEELTTWAADKGEIPPRCKLIAFWRGRIVLAGDADDPQDWHMSALGEPDNWDKDPATYVATMSISGNNARCGRSPDIVKALVPYNDDLLIFGCDSSIYRLTGDPMSGGQMDTVSTTIGMAGGDAWCKDPEGVIYFFGSQGGVYALSVKGELLDISSTSIRRRLEDVDLSSNKVVLEWCDKEQGLYCFLVPNTPEGVHLVSWYWDKRTNSWWEDKLTGHVKQPTCAAIMDGDSAGDRALLFGSEDGYIRKHNFKGDLTGNEDDDGSTIESEVLLGPVVQEESMHRLRFSKLRGELAKGSNYLGYRWSVTPESGDDSEESTDANQITGTFTPSPSFEREKITGSNMWLRLYNNSSQQAWTLEALSVSVTKAGRKRDATVLDPPPV